MHGATMKFIEAQHHMHFCHNSMAIKTIRHDNIR